MKRLDRTDDESVRDEIDKRVVELEAARVLETTWIHVDMDGAFILRIFIELTKYPAEIFHGQIFLSILEF